MNLVDPSTLLRALRVTFAPRETVSWLDFAAAIYAVISWESHFDLDAAHIEPDGSVSLGLGQVNQRAWQPTIGTLAMPSGMQEQIDYIAKGPGGQLARSLARVAQTINTRVSSGERGIHFNPVFDAPLFASIGWQYGTRALEDWIATPGSALGEDGFRAWREAKGDPVQPDYTQRQAEIRAAYSTALDQAQVAGGLLAMLRQTAIDWASGAREGLSRLAELTGVPTAIAEAEAWGAALEQKFADEISRSLHAFDWAVKALAVLQGISMIVGTAFVGYIAYKWLQHEGYIA